jgi:type II secretory pathway component PulC
MNQTPHRCLLALAAISCGYHFEVGAQPYDPTRSPTQSQGQALADVIGTIAPYVENGQVAGARIGRPGSLFRALGIERGDVVVQVNGESLTGAQSVLQLITGLAHAQSFELVVRSPTGAARTVRCANRQTGCTGP